MMGQPWIFCGAGILLCLAGVYGFHKTIYEENKKILGPVLLMIGGVTLIGIGTAKYFNLIN
jgi:hypothetical protein